MVDYKQHQQVYSFLSKTLTCGDVAKPFIDQDVPFYDGNFHITTYDAYYGDGSIQSAPAFVNDVIYFSKGNLRDIWFKNYTSGSNSIIVFAGTVPNWFTEKYTKY